MRYLLAAFLALAALSAEADDRTALYGTWGSPGQCAGDVLVPGGSKRAEPFEIRAGWLRQGDMWCLLSWFPVQPRDDGLFATARARCGEDSVQGYRVDMVLDSDVLTLIWDEGLINDGLARCDRR